MYELLKDVSQAKGDQLIEQLARMEEDSERRILLMERRDEIYSELQDIYKQNPIDEARLKVVETKLESLRRMVELIS